MGHREALYTYQADYAAGKFYGLLQQSDARPALVSRGFMPASIRIKVVPLRGPLLVTVSDSLSVYTQSRYKEGAAAAGGAQLAGYEDSKAVSIHGCLNECLQSWKPVLAAAQDQPSGYFEIAQRADGMRQWLYKGAALYTY